MSQQLRKSQGPCITTPERTCLLLLPAANSDQMLTLKAAGHPKWYHPSSPFRRGSYTVTAPISSFPFTIPVRQGHSQHRHSLAVGESHTIPAAMNPRAHVPTTAWPFSDVASNCLQSTRSTSCLPGIEWTATPVLV